MLAHLFFDVLSCFFLRLDDLAELIVILLDGHRFWALMGRHCTVLTVLLLCVLVRTTVRT